MNTTAILLRTETGLDNLEIIAVGTIDEVKSKAFEILMPSFKSRNLEKLDSDEGYLYKVELLKEGQWKEYKYFILFHHSQN